MRFSEILRLVFINMIQNRSKVLLTSLGVIVGSATIVLVIAIGKGGQADVADQFRNLNAGAIEVAVGTGVDIDAMDEMIGGGGGDMSGSGFGGFSGSMPSMSGGNMTMPSFGGGASGGASGGMPGMGGGDSGGGGSSGSGRTVTLDTDDVDDIAAYVPDVSEVTILVSGDTTVYGGSLDEEETKTVVGVQENYQTVSNLELLYGNFITEEDDSYKSYVAVIGYSAAAELFTYPALALGDYVEIDDKNYEIVGVLAEMGSVTSGISPDDAIFVPYSTAEKYIFGSTEDPTISAVASEVSEVDSVMDNIETVLTENHPGGYFDISDAGSAMEAAESSADTLAMLLLAVASIVFVVGGIGIMNVLFVSVKERTEEIGILKAIGCSNSVILLEFVLEANIIGVFGGILGIAASFGIVPLIEMFGMRLETSLLGYVLALVFAVVTGTLFGFYPAYKASKLVPIEALTLE